MCPYYNENNNTCKIYKTLQSEYNAKTFCREESKSCTECANYKACKNSYGGIMPPPSRF